jgi:hypothetical protein
LLLLHDLTLFVCFSWCIRQGIQQGEAYSKPTGQLEELCGICAASSKSQRRESLTAASQRGFRSFWSSAHSGEKARVLVVGSGRMGKIWALLISTSPHFELCGIVDPQLSAAEALARKFDVSHL